MKTHVHTKTCTQMLIAALVKTVILVTAQMLLWTNKMWCVNIVGYYLAMKQTPGDPGKTQKFRVSE